MRRSSSERSDADLIHAAGRDPAAFGELRRHAGTVHVWFAKRIEWAASDLTAETLAEAWLCRDRFRDEREGSALSWLLGIARNGLRESARRDRIETAARERLGLPLDLATEDGYAKVDERLSPRRALAEALGGLPEHEREALELRIVDELPYETVARDRRAVRPAERDLSVGRPTGRLGLRRAAAPDLRRQLEHHLRGVEDAARRGARRACGPGKPAPSTDPDAAKEGEARLGSAAPMNAAASADELRDNVLGLLESGDVRADGHVVADGRAAAATLGLR